MTKHIITNRYTFSEKVKSVDASGLKFTGFRFKGTLKMVLADGRQWEAWGEHAPKEYDREFGFRLATN